LEGTKMAMEGGYGDGSVFINMDVMNPTDEAMDDGDGDIETAAATPPNLGIVTDPFAPQRPPPPRKRAGSIVLGKFYVFYYFD
jgi:hypothetical protein